jgi:hypothetical protein
MGDDSNVIGFKAPRASHRCSTSRDSLTGCIPGTGLVNVNILWIKYGDVCIIYMGMKQRSLPGVGRYHRYHRY